jgi:murein DD-endopeptidase MepM/ murein hydrolase activator NlpD
MRRLRILLELLVVGTIAAYGGADFFLSGGKFAWPPPPQLMPDALVASARAQMDKLSPAPRSDAATPPTQTASSAPPPADPPPADTASADPAPPPAPDPPAPDPAPAPVATPSCPDTPSTASIAFVDGLKAYYCAPGHLTAGSGKGVPDGQVWSPGMRFPIDAAPAYANSQVWGIGGTNGTEPDGAQSDARNYSYPWRDDFCETRDYATSQCPGGKGHQGQDIRPAHCCDKQYHDRFRVDAAEDGTVTSIGSYTVYFTADSGRLYRYLHMDMKALKSLGVEEGVHLKRGQQIGWLSDNFGGTATTFHLHFEIKQAVTDSGGNTSYTWVPPYSSLVLAYTRLLKGDDKPAKP